MIQLFLEEHWRNIGGTLEVGASFPRRPGSHYFHGNRPGLLQGFLPRSRPSLPSVAGPIREVAVNALCPLTLNAGRPEIARTRRKGLSRLLRLVDPALAESMLQALALKPSHRYFPRQRANGRHLAMPTYKQARPCRVDGLVAFGSKGGPDRDALGVREFSR